MERSGIGCHCGGKFLPGTPEIFGHDFDGNLTSDGRFAYTWDVENRLIAMETHATIPTAARRKLSFAYDSMGRRIRKTVWHGSANGGWQLYHQIDFLHELGGWNLLAERSGGSTGTFLRSYTWGTDLSGTHNGAGGIGGLLFCTLHTSGKTFAYGSDLNGNVTLLIATATGQSAATYDYGPFGESLRQSGEYAALNPYRFSTKYTDNETGLLDYGYRLYNPSTGRWLSRDPIEERGGMNLYGFVGSDGVNQKDLLGAISVCDCLDFYLESSKHHGGNALGDRFKGGSGARFELPPSGHFLTTNEHAKGIPWSIKSEWNDVGECGVEKVKCTNYARSKDDLTLVDVSVWIEGAKTRSNSNDWSGSFAPGNNVSEYHNSRGTKKKGCK